MDRSPSRITAEPARLVEAATAADQASGRLDHALADYRVALRRLGAADLADLPPDRSWEVEEASGHLRALRRGLELFAEGASTVDAHPRSAAERAVLAADVGLEGGDAAATVIDHRVRSTAAGGLVWGRGAGVGGQRAKVSPVTASRLVGGVARVSGGVARVSGPAGIALTGAGQVARDANNPELTDGARIARAGAATVADGGLGAVGAAGGAKLGAAAGTLIAPGVGTVAGLILGGVVGGIVGGAAGGRLRTTLDPAVTRAGHRMDGTLAGWRKVQPVPARTTDAPPR